jgi:hypothetical protein
MGCFMVLQELQTRANHFARILKPTALDLLLNEAIKVGSQIDVCHTCIFLLGLRRHPLPTEG